MAERKMGKKNDTIRIFFFFWWQDPNQEWRKENKGNIAASDESGQLLFLLKLTDGTGMFYGQKCSHRENLKKRVCVTITETEYEEKTFLKTFLISSVYMYLFISNVKSEIKAEYMYF